MTIAVVNPNATETMTASIAAAAEAVARPETRIIALTNHDGPASIEGSVDGALAVPGLLAQLKRAEGEGAQGFVVACFDDTGAEAARALLGGPVVGIGEAAARMATLVARRFGVVTTLSCSVPIIEDNLLRQGLLAACSGVRASEIPVLALESDPDAAREIISDQIAKAIAEDGAEAIVLGCAGMADLAETLSKAHAVPVIEGVAAAVTLIEAALALGLRTSKRGAYAPPRAKPGSLL